MSVRLNITKHLLNSVLKTNVRYPTFNAGRSVISVRPSVGNGKSVTKLQLSGSALNTFKRAFSTQVEALNLTVEENGNVSTFKIAVPLPSDGKMLFSLKGDQSVKQFLSNLKEEDSTVETASISTSDGTKISSTAQLNDVLRSSFRLTINNNTFTVTPVAASGAPALAAAVTGSSVSSTIDLDKLEAIQERRREEKFNQLLKEFLPLYLEKQKHDKRASFASNLFMWGGLGYLIAQWCVLARLTWWEFNWDIMEPVTYFITFGTGVLGYAYFAITKREYTYNDLRDSVKDKRRLANYINKGFDVEKYYVLEHKLKSLDGDALARVEVIADEHKNQLEAPKA